MREGWKKVKLGDVCKLEKNKHQGEGLAYVGLEHIESGTGRFLGSLNPVNVRSETFCFDPQHILFGRLRPYLNKVFLPDFKGHCSSEIFPMKVNTEILKSFLYYWITSQPIVNEINRTCTGTRMPRANVNEIMNFDINLPTLPEQKRIIAILDEVFAGIDKAVANTEKNIANVRELYENIIINRIVGDPDTKDWSFSLVKDLAKSKKGSIRTGPFGSQLLHSEFVEDGVSVLGIDNVVKNKFLWGKRRYINYKKYKELEKYTIKPFDVLISIMGTCGRCAVVPEDIPLSINSKHLCCITLDQKKCIPDFLHSYFLYHPIARKYLKLNSKGSIMSGLNMGIIKELPVRLPSLQEQRNIIEAIKELSSQSQQIEQIYQQKISALTELKQSLLQKAFSGELTSKSCDELEKAAA